MRDPLGPAAADLVVTWPRSPLVLGLLRVARFAGFLLGALGLFSGVADLCGLVPHSEEMPAFGRRLLTNLPTLLVSAMLLLPYAKVAATGFWYAVVAGFALATIALTVRTAQAMSEYLAGGLHWEAVPASLFLLFLLSSNALVLWQARRQPEQRA